ncbi:hypothetical protein ACOKFD_12330 [Flagellimonas sp. S174]|uniref:hypothetical protein n=1 Tax=Flagellimonas sp. S174 TaxID=3410790 RepID=UPI003BF5A992
MKNYLSIFLIFFLFSSCIPLRVAPSIKDYKIVKGKKFRRSLPKKTVYVFEDPKEANEFYDYVNIKFDLEDFSVDVDVPFYVNNKKYAFSFYEVEIPDKTINLIPVVADALLSRADMDPVFDEIHETRKGNFYIAMEVYDELGNDILLENSSDKKQVIQYLSNLKNEYLNTHNYNEVVFKN